jgi:hypothetical protein
MATTALLSLNLKIGQTEIPISTPIPPPKDTKVKFSYELEPNATEPKYIVSVGDFCTWAANIGFSGAATDLPSSLQALSVGIKKIVVDTDAGEYDAAVIFGKKDGAGKWTADWKPADGIPLTFSNVALEVEHEPEKK